jgi:hypothetical protein
MAIGWSWALPGKLVVRWHLIRVDGGPLSVGEPACGEDPLNHRVLRAAVIVDVGGGRPGPPLHSGVLLAQMRIGWPSAIKA